MTCEELAAHIKALKDEIFNRQSTIAGYKNGLKAKTSEGIVDELHSHNGIDKDAIKTDLNNSLSDPKQGEEIRQASEAVADGALHNWNSFKDNKAWMSSKVDNMRQKFNDMFTRAFNYKPQKANDNLNRFILNFAGDKTLIKLGDSSTYAGSAKAKMIQISTEKLYNEVGKDSGLKFKDFTNMMQARFAMRGKDISSFIAERRAKIAGGDTKFANQEERLLGLVEQANSKPNVKEALDNYMAKEYADLDVARDFAIKKGILKESVGKEGQMLAAGRQDYTPSIIALADHQNPWDERIYGKDVTTSKFGKQKTYNNMFEAMEAGYMPASLDFRDVAGHYWRTFANATRFRNAAEELRGNGSMETADNKRLMINSSLDHAEPAVVTREMGKVKWETPMASNGKAYQDLGNIFGKGFTDIYAHPDFYKWAESTFRNVNVNGIFKIATKANNFLRGTVLEGSSVYHGVSLATKATSLGAATGQGGIRTFWNLKTMMGEGLSTINEGQHFGILQKAIDNGFTIDSYDMLRNSALNREYNIKTGNTTVMTKFSDAIKTVGDWTGHSYLFDKARPGVKVGMLTRMVNSEYFENLVKKNGGDVDKSYQMVSQLLNDHFGGQNLEAIGRAKWVQTMMQASLLAPDWTESKMRRMFGSVLNADPAARRAYQLSLAAEFGTILLLKPGIQAAMSMYTGNPRSLDEQKDDALGGHLGSIYVGKTVGKKPKDLFISVFGTVNQDSRVIINLVKASLETAELKDKAALPKAAKEEFLTRASPAIQFFEGLGKKEPSGPNPRAYPYLPIGAQSAVFASKGGLGGTTPEEITTRTLQAAAASGAGMPFTAIKSLETKKKEEKAALKSEAKKEAKKKRNLSIMQ